MSTQNEVAKKTEKKVKTVRGKVTADKMDKSRVLTVTRMVKHPVVGKYIKKTTKIMFHDEKNETKIGDNVEVAPIKPMSKRKNFTLHRKL